MDRCPVCQARLKQDPACPRCKADLARAQAAEAGAARRLARAVAALAYGREAEALAAADASLSLRRTPLATRLQGFLRRRLAPPS